MRAFELVLASVMTASSVACGGSVTPDGADSSADADTGSQAEVATDTAMEVDAASTCTFANGGRICNAECPSDPTTCDPCVEFRSVAGSTIPLGICANDAKTMTASRCPKCASVGFLCAQQLIDEQAVCVAPVFCETALARGISQPCYWPDLTPWSGPAAIPTAACPKIGLALCGGGCDVCPAGLSCFGRSPTHPVGVCGAVMRAGGMSTGCRRGSFGCQVGEACATFKVEPAQQPLSDEHGFCIDGGRCKSIRDVLPGGIRCGGPGGTEL